MKFQAIKMLFDLYVPSFSTEDEHEGQGMVEYALILVLVAIAAIVILGTLGGQVDSVFEQVSNTLGGGGEAAD